MISLRYALKYRWGNRLKKKYDDRHNHNDNPLDKKNKRSTSKN